MSFFYPFADGGVEPLRHQQAQGKIVQHPLHGALPSQLLALDLQQLTDKGELTLIEPQFGTEPFTNGQLLTGNVALSFLQRGELVAQLLQAGILLPLLLLERVSLLLQLRQLALQCFGLLLGGGQVADKALGRQGIRQIQRFGQAAVTQIVLPRRVALLAQAVHLPLQLLQAATAIFQDLLLQGGNLLLLFTEPAIQALALQHQLVQALAAALQSFLIQCDGMLGHEAIGQLPALLNVLLLLFGLQHLFPQSADGFQQLHFLAGGDHRIMQPLEIVIVALQLLDQPLDIGLGQHVLTHEVGDRAHGFHGDGLVEEIQRLAIATQSQCLAEGLLVRAEAVELLAFRLLF